MVNANGQSKTFTVPWRKSKPSVKEEPQWPSRTGPPFSKTNGTGSNWVAVGATQGEGKARNISLERVSFGKRKYENCGGMMEGKTGNRSESNRRDGNKAQDRKTEQYFHKGTRNTLDLPYTLQRTHGSGRSREYPCCGLLKVLSPGCWRSVLSAHCLGKAQTPIWHGNYNWLQSKTSPATPDREVGATDN